MKTIVLYGASGDLAQQKILPAYKSVSKSNPDLNLIKVSRFAKPGYCTPEQLDSQLRGASSIVYLLSTPANTYLQLIKTITTTLPAGSIALEKPWASNLQEFEEISKTPNLIFLDHYAYKKVPELKPEEDITDIFVLEERKHQIQDLGLDLVHSHAITLADNYYKTCFNITQIIKINSQTYQVVLGTISYVVHIGKGLINFKSIRLSSGQQHLITSGGEYEKMLHELYNLNMPNHFISTSAALNRWQQFQKVL
jgi:hypothetical protein